MSLKTKTVVKKFRGLDFGWMEEGDRKDPLLIFLHGFPDGPAIWNFQSVHFQGNFQVVRPFLRGLPPTEASSQISRYGTDSTSLDLLEMLDVLDARRTRPIFIVAHDLGTVHAWNLAGLLGKRLHGLVIINGLSIAQMVRRFSDLRQQFRSWYMYFMQVPFLPELVSRALGAVGHRLAYAKGGLPSDLQPHEPNVTKHLPQLLNTYRAFAREIPTHYDQKMPRLECPVLVLWGNDDSFLLPPRLAEIEPFCKRVTIRILEGNHWIYRERPQEVNTLIEDFIYSVGTGYEQSMANSL